MSSKLSDISAALFMTFGIMTAPVSGAVFLVLDMRAGFVTLLVLLGLTFTFAVLSLFFDGRGR